MKQRIPYCVLALVLSGCALKVEDPLRVQIDHPVQVRAALVDAAAEGAGQPRYHSEGVSPYAGAVADIGVALDESLRHQGIRRLPITVSPFWNLRSPQQMEQFGRELAEHFTHELQTRGYNLVEHASVTGLTPSGALKPSKLQMLYDDHRISYLLTGSYAVHSDQVVIQARILDTLTLQVVASGQSSVATAELEGGLPGYDPLSSQRGMIVENQGVPVNGQ